MRADGGPSSELGRMKRERGVARKTGVSVLALGWKSGCSAADWC